jgi:glycosyltransferase involved in cell wall biosynthesis
VAGRRRMVLFDWVSGGHHAVYLRRFADALGSHFDIVLAVPDEVIPEVADLPVDIVPLGKARPAAPAGRSPTWALRAALAREVELMASIAARIRPDHVVHAYADTVLPRLVTARQLAAPLTIVLFYPRAHYPALYETRLTPTERFRAAMKERLVQSWRQRSDANAVLTLDEEAARRWDRKRGAPAYWLPEPPIPALPREAATGSRRVGCILYGALAERKGIDLLARAVSFAPNALEITLAGEATAEFLPRLEEYVAKMRESGASVEVRSHRHTELDGLRALAASRCAVLPYPRHDGMSRVLLEAASVGTPVIAHDRGLLGHLVRRHRLGLAVDCTNPRTLRDAVFDLTENPARVAEYADALARFSARFSPDRFVEACMEPFSETMRVLQSGRGSLPMRILRMSRPASIEANPPSSPPSSSPDRRPLPR